MANVYLEHLRALMRLLRGSDITVLLLAPASTKIRASIDTLAATVERGQGSVRAAQLAISWHRYEGSRLAVLSHRVYDWLQSQPAFEIVVFGGAGGAAYYSLVARAQGLALSGARVALVESLTRRLELDRRVGSGVSLLELEEDYMQRSASSLADALFVSAAALRSMQARAWRLPLLVELWGVLDGSHAAWGGAPRRRPGAPPEADSSRRGSTGRCDAACCGQACASPPVRLLLRWSLDYVHRNAHSFGTRVLAVAPSSDTPDTTTPAAEAAIRPGIVWSPLGVHEPCAHESCAHRSRDRKVGGDGGAVAAGVRSTLHAPLVSVCVVHHDRGELLQQALQSVRGQTLEPGLVQVVLVDDGSTSTEALAALAAIDAWEEFSSGRWLLLRRPSRYLGAARNEAARHAVAPFLVFLDDDNFLKPHALATLARSAELSHAHILTMVNEKWPRAAAPPNADASSERWLPLGGAAVVGVFRNCFGDANALVRRTTFEALGGFTEDSGVGHEDWELWVRAVLRGYHILVVPEPLYWYRVLASGGMLAESLGSGAAARAQLRSNHARNIRPYLQRLAGCPEAQELLLLTEGLSSRSR
jgi:GT2 family glycosyltransferase